jgi:glucokinase
MLVIAGDVGATHARLGLFNTENRNFRALSLEKYATKKFDNLGQMVQAFLSVIDARPRAAAFGIAGPVIDGICRATNLPWTIDVERLSGNIGIKRTTIVNDFVAHAHGLSALKQKDLAVMQKGRHEGLANKALIGPGTGLGEALIAQHGGDAVIVASEGGHTDFGPQDELQMELLEFLQDKYGHVSYERVISGQGGVDIYEFLKKMKAAKESAKVSAELKKASPTERPRVILRNAYKDRLCRKTANLFFSVLGSEAGNVALQSFAVGGVYLAGEAVREHTSLLKQSPFLTRFRNKGRMSGLMRQIPVYVVKNEQLGLLGAAVLASELF